MVTLMINSPCTDSRVNLLRQHDGLRSCNLSTDEAGPRTEETHGTQVQMGGGEKSEGGGGDTRDGGGDDI